ncbi:MAG TPA: head GIN domain-containing protein, partial [Spirochaetia bacterium]|nr:head GIN domain-containing protein [Spirochaetia bacterium]
MKHRAFLLLMILATLPFLSCTLIEVVSGSGEVITESRSIQSADSIVLKGMGDLRVSQGNETALVVVGEDNILPFVKTRVENGTLIIEVSGDNGPVVIMPTRQLRYTLTLQSVRSVETLGSGNVEVSGNSTRSVTLKSSGSGSIHLQAIDADEVVAVMTGSGNIEAGGVSSSVRVASYGSGRALLSGLSAREADVVLSGSGDAYLRVSDRLSAKSYGSG